MLTVCSSVLQWVKGEIWANIYGTFCIARIEPSSGQVREAETVRCCQLVLRSILRPKALQMVVRALMCLVELF